MSKFPYTNGNKIKFIDIESILYIKADGNYCEVIMKNNKSNILVRKTITNFISELNSNTDIFIKVNRSIAVNVNDVEEIIKSGYNEVHIKINNELFRISKSQKKYLFIKLGLIKALIS